MEGKMEKEKKTKKSKSVLKKGLKLMKPKVLLLIAFIVVIVFASIAIKDKFFTESRPVKLGLEDIGELATQAAYVNEINVTENARDLFGVEIPFTQSKVIFSYNVAVKAGYDFSQIKYSVNDVSKTIKVTLPEAKVLSCEVDPHSFKSYHEQQSIFTPFEIKDYNSAVKDLTEDAEKEAIANGLLEEAKKNGEVIISSFFYQAYDKDEYKIEFSTDKETK